jgi:hypothetical protein
MGGALSSPIVLYSRRNFMIILKKDNHYEHTADREKAQQLVNDGFEVLKDKSGGPKIVKQAAAPKKKMFAKKKK